MTFPGHFWNLKNFKKLVPGAPKTSFLSSEARVRQGRTSEIMYRNRSKSLRIGLFRSCRAQSPCSSLHMRGLRRWRPYPPFASVGGLVLLGGRGVPPSREPRMCPLRQGGVSGLRKNDIQSWVLIRPFSANFGPRNGREIAICPTKKLDF